MRMKYYLRLNRIRMRSIQIDENEILSEGKQNKDEKHTDR